jgi:hypothetical protein
MKITGVGELGEAVLAEYRRKKARREETGSKPATAQPAATSEPTRSQPYEWSSLSVHEKLLDRRSRTAAAEFIKGYGHWQFFVTLTFRYDVSERAAHIMFRDFFRRYAKLQHAHLLIAFSWGRQRISNRLHFHAVVGTKYSFTRLNVEDAKDIPWKGKVEVSELVKLKQSRDAS